MNTTYQNLILLLENGRRTPEQTMEYADIFLMYGRISGKEYQQLYELCYPAPEVSEEPEEPEEPEVPEEPEEPEVPEVPVEL